MKKRLPTWKWQLAVWWNNDVFRIAWANSKTLEPGMHWKNIKWKLWVVRQAA